MQLSLHKLFYRLLPLFYNIPRADVQRRFVKKVLLKFRKIHRKTCVPESLFLWSCRLRPIKETAAHVFSYKFCEVFKNSFFGCILNAISQLLRLQQKFFFGVLEFLINKLWVNSLLWLENYSQQFPEHLSL